MSGGLNQRTLFQSWGGSAPQNKVAPQKHDGKKAPGRRKTTPSNVSQVTKNNPPRNPLWPEIGHGATNTPEEPQPEYGDDEDDDDLILVAVTEAEERVQFNIQPDIPAGAESSDLPIPLSGEKTYPDFPDFDSSSAKVWIYPINYPIRDYQLKISEAALFQNTLVCLPTGLGKTFIASVVMYNFYRWYPAGKIVFMAPTKPLVAQQIEACYKVMGIPQAHMAELTGSTAAKQRQTVWRTKRVFFLTPQVMVNDLSRETCPAQQVKCVVIDEAHKALGNHAYCQVIRQLGSQTQQFRILALSATPGGDTKSVQSVITNLLISHIELRSDESPDIRAHSHERSVDKVVVPLGEVLSAFQGRYLQVLQKFMSRLVMNRVMAQKDLRTLSKYQLILARDQFRKNPPPNVKGPMQGVLEGDFALCISLYHGYELLMQMGLRSLFFYIQGIMDGSREMSRARNELQRTPTFTDLYSEMEAMFAKPSAGPDEPFIYSHPKLEKLEEVVLQHFRQWAETSPENNGPGEVSTRVMIFSSYRDSVQEIAAMLDRHAPLIRVMTFMGQASAGKGVKGFTQKEQLEVVHRFRQGGFNTLVSTCVGEEGLDIGEVDLIVCFDAQKNPTRLVQRMGRTGRKRQGRIVVILASGREERIYNQSQCNKRSVYRSITGNRSSFHMYPNSPRMLPEGVNPSLHKMNIVCGQFEHQESSRRASKSRRSHPEGRASLIHPQNFFQDDARSDGLPSTAEFSRWKLQEADAHPVLGRSRFMSLPNDLPPQEDVPEAGPASRELSLWEWRHWQHRALPTHVVEHSLRCQHFVEVMALIDDMKEEPEGECRYEQELLPYLQEAEDRVTRVSKKPKSAKRSDKATSEPKPPRPKLSHPEWIDEEEDEQQRLPLEYDTEAPYEDLADHPGPEAICERLSGNDCPEADPGGDCVLIDEDVRAGEPVNSDRGSPKIDDDEDAELQALFYLPSWDSAPSPPLAKFRPGADEAVRLFLANAAELLSRSPPPVPEDLEVNQAAPPPVPSPRRPFHIDFTLDVDDDDEEVMSKADDGASPKAQTNVLPAEDSEIHHDQPNANRGSITVPSPTWDEVFEDREVDNNQYDDKKTCREDETAKDAWTNDHAKLKNGSVTAEEESSWDDGRDEEVPALTQADVRVTMDLQMDDSMDLFPDDEAFLQMSIPEVSTPGANNNTKNASSFSHARTPKTPSSTAPTAAEGGNAAHTEHLNVTPRDAIETEDDIHVRPVAAKTMSAGSKSPSEQSFNNSHDFFSVNFDLGYSLEDSEDEVDGPAPCAPASPPPPPANRVVSDSSTPCSSFHMPRRPGQHGGPGLSTPHALSERRPGGASSLLASIGGALPSPVFSPGAGRTFSPASPGPRTSSFVHSLKRKRPTAEAEESFSRPPAACSPPRPALCLSDSDEEVGAHKRRLQHKVNPLSSQEMVIESKICSDVDSPVVARRRRLAALDTSGEVDGEAASDDDFQNESVFRCRTATVEKQKGKAKRATRRKGRQFLDEEAELSEDDEGSDVSSDEEDGEELNRSLEGFVVNNTHLSQGLNDSEMHGVYLKSVRSPVVQGKFKMSYRNHNNMDIFSQVPEMDETYAEDSFVVGSEEEVEEEGESSEDEAEASELLPENSYVDGRRQYATRRRVFLHKARARAAAAAPPGQREGAKAKRARVIRINDSSEEEEEEAEGAGSSRGLAAGGGGVAEPLWPRAGEQKPPTSSSSSSASSSTIAAKISRLSRAQKCSEMEQQQSDRCRQRIENQHLLSDELDFMEPESLLSSKKTPQVRADKTLPDAATSAPARATAQEPAANQAADPGRPVCILADSRCISSAVELITCLRQRHAAAVHVCSLDASYFIVSNRAAVERHSQSDLASMQNRKRLTERVKSLQGLFERVCLIVEKDRTKPGETSRPFQRTRYYDNTLMALVRSGVRLLWSAHAKESAALLADLAKLEQRKGHGIAVPPEVRGQHREQALQLYLSLPSVNYAQALNLCHNFSCVAQLINSPIEAIQKGGCMSRARAEEFYRFVRYSCDSVLMKH